MNNKSSTFIYFIILTCLVVIISWSTVEYFSRILAKKIHPLEQKLDSLSTSSNDIHEEEVLPVDEKKTGNLIKEPQNAPVIKAENIDECNQKLQLIISIHKLLTAIQVGQFYHELPLVKNLSIHNINLVDKLNILSKYSDRGIYTLNTLQENFEIVANQALSQRNPDSEDYVEQRGKIMAFLKKLVIIQRVEYAHSVAQMEQLFTKAKLAMSVGNVEEAVKLVNELPEHYFVLIKDWVENAQKYLIVHDTAKQIYNDLIIGQVIESE